MPDCPKCGKHCAAAQGLAAHMRSHDRRLTPCPVAGCEAKLRRGSGLDHHLTSVHGITAKARRSDAKKDEEFRRLKLQATLKRLVPSLAGVYLDRLLALALTHAPTKGAFVVIGPEFGPVMVARVMVGQIVAKAGAACIVVDLDVLREAQEAAEISARYGS